VLCLTVAMTELAPAVVDAGVLCLELPHHCCCRFFGLSCACLLLLSLCIQVVLERACQAAAERADNDFRQLLQQGREAGSITAVSTWVAAKPSVSGRGHTFVAVA
jgi:hypothetical protein